MSNERLEDEFRKAQQALMDSFKLKFKDICEDVLGSIYTDVTQYASTDAHTNYHNYLRDHFKESLTKEITEEYTHYSWAHAIRMTLLEKYPDKIRSKIIDELEDKITSLEKHIEDMRKYR